MRSTANIVLLDQNSIVKSRIKDIFSSSDISEHHKIVLFEAANRRDFLRIMAQTGCNIDLIISETVIDSKNNFDGISLINLVKSKRSSIPVILLTSDSRKDVITRYLREGAADYILKPFKDEYLKERLLKYINLESLTESTVINFNLKNYLDSEIYKAKKGNYVFSLLSLQFHSSAEDESELSENSFYTYSDLIFQEIKGLFWESDLYIQHGFQSHLGFFPFCDEAHIKVILRKIDKKFDALKDFEPNIGNYCIACAYATYPTDAKKTHGLLKLLDSKR